MIVTNGPRPSRVCRRKTKSSCVSCSASSRALSFGLRSLRPTMKHTTVVLPTSG